MKMKNIEEQIKKDIEKSGLNLEFMEKQGIKVFKGTEEELAAKLGFTPPNLNNSAFLEFPHYGRNKEYLFSEFKEYSLAGISNYWHPKNIPSRPYISEEVWAVADKPNKSLWFTEGVKKAIKLLKELCLAIALSGVFNFKAGKDSDDEESKYLWEELMGFNLQGRTIFLAFDMDLWVNPQVRNALWEFTIRLYGQGAIVKFVTWDGEKGKGIDDYLANFDNPKAEIIELEKKAKGVTEFLCPDHQDAILRALTVVNLPVYKEEPLLKTIAKKLGISFKTLEKEVKNRKIRLDEKQKNIVEISEEDKSKALEILRSPDLVERFLAVCRRRYCGRTAVLILLKLATVSRLLRRGVSVVIFGVSGVGKSELLATILETIHPNNCEDFTSSSELHLAYREDSLDKIILTFFEMKGTEKLMHILRTALTEGKINHGTVVKIKGQLTPLKIEKSAEGLVLLSTTTSTKLDPEFENRVLRVNINHEPPLFREAYRLQTADGNNDASEDFELFQVADYLLQSYEVMVPYQKALAEKFPIDQERYARDFNRLIALIKSSALLHQYQREKDERGRLMATQYDYEVVYELRHLIGDSVSALPEKVLNFLRIAQKTPDATRKELSRIMGVSEKTISRHMQQCVKEELIEVEGRGPKQKITVLTIPEMVSPLPAPEEIFGPDGSKAIGKSIDSSEGSSDNLTEHDKEQCPVQVVENKEVNSNWTNGQPNEGTLFPSSPETTVAVLDKDVEAKEEKTFEYWLEKCRAAGKEEEFLDWCNQITGKEYGAIQDIPADALEMIVEFLNKCENVIETFCLQNQDKSGVS